MHGFDATRFDIYEAYLKHGRVKGASGGAYTFDHHTGRLNLINNWPFVVRRSRVVLTPALTGWTLFAAARDVVGEIEQQIVSQKGDDQSPHRLAWARWTRDLLSTWCYDQEESKTHIIHLTPTEVDMIESSRYWSYHSTVSKDLFRSCTRCVDGIGLGWWVWDRGVHHDEVPWKGHLLTI